ncbi:hypothetical protein NPIL_546111 [Nephila pilipes]|uniref:Uncharacterized protein n=1 Tax=Nephila pilipes TaxID=299642 RepID=A0A8X6TD74_NEPPI|nr:hypothetical protein NPIL_546111 [Nephila pilipes]
MLILTFNLKLKHPRVMKLNKSLPDVSSSITSRSSKSMLRPLTLPIMSNKIGTSIYKLLLSFLTQVAPALSVSDTHQFPTHNSKHLELAEQSDVNQAMFRKPGRFTSAT